MTPTPLFTAADEALTAIEDLCELVVTRKLTTPNGLKHAIERYYFENVWFALITNWSVREWADETTRTNP